MQNQNEKYLELQADEIYLVKQCCQKNQLAQRVLYETYFNRLLGVAMRYMASKDEAEDVLHDCFILIFKKIQTFKHRSGLYSWLTRIVINACLGILRKKNKKEFLNIAEIKDPEDEIESDEIEHLSTQQILELLKKLPIGYSTVLSLYSIDGLSHAEIGAQLGISESSSRSQLTRARKSFRDLLNEMNS